MTAAASQRRPLSPSVRRAGYSVRGVLNGDCTVHFGDQSMPAPGIALCVVLDDSL
jgi:hypothetical protein